MCASPPDLVDLGLNMKNAIILSVLLGVMGISSAQSYVGASLTLNKYDIGCAANNTCKNKLDGYDFRVGSKLSPEHVVDIADVLKFDRVQVGLARFGRVQAAGSKSELYYNWAGGTSTRAISTSNSIAANALYVAALTRSNLATNFDLVGKLGLAYVTTTSSYRSSGITEGSRVENHFAPLLGLGLEYGLIEGVSLDAGFDVTRFRADGRSGTIKSVRIGANYTF